MLQAYVDGWMRMEPAAQLSLLPAYRLSLEQLELRSDRYAYFALHQAVVSCASLHTVLV